MNNIEHLLLFRLEGVYCLKCVNKVKVALSDLPNVLTYQVTKTDAHIVVTLEAQKSLNSNSNTTPLLAEIITQIEHSISSLGYHAILQPSQVEGLCLTLSQKKQTFNLTLQGLSCAKCVDKVKTELEKLPSISLSHISKEKACITFYSYLPDNNFNTQLQQALSCIQALGYQAEITNASSLNQEKPEYLQPLTIDVIEKSIESSIKYPQQTLKIIGMTCASCVTSVEAVFDSFKTQGLSEYYVNLAEGTAYVKGPQSIIDSAIELLNKKGYTTQQQNNTQANLAPVETLSSLLMQTLVALIFGVGLMGYGLVKGMQLTESNRLVWAMLGLVTLITMVYAGGHFYRNAFNQLKYRQTNMDTLVVLGISSAWGYSFLLVMFPDLITPEQRHMYFEASIMIVGLINLGKYLETKAKKKSSQALSYLLNLAPQTATVIKSTGDESIEVHAITPNMMLRLRTGDTIPVDGIIQSGIVTIDESLLTGEVNPVVGKIDRKVYAGTLVLTGSASILTTEVGETTALAQIIYAVQKAQSSKPKLGRLADQIAHIFVPTILAIAGLTALIWGIWGPSPKISYMMVTTISVLIIACPCALGLAIPMSIITSVGRTARLGVLIRDASVLERANHIDTLIFDKTGTLTEGKPKLTGVLLCQSPHQIANALLAAEQLDDVTLSLHAELLGYAVQLESGSSHPFASAIKTAYLERRAHLAERGISITLPSFDCEHFETAPGLGLKGIINNNTYFIGNIDWLEQNQINPHLTDDISQVVAECEKQGSSILYFAINQQLVSLFVVRDILKANAKNLIQALSKKYDIWLLTGDNHHNASFVADQLSITQVLSNIKPIDKANHITSLQKTGKRVAMIGDGINDAPALALADLSIAMGHGSDIAKQSADYILLNNDLATLPDIFLLAKQVESNMKQNLFFAFAYNVLLVPIAAGILYPFTGLLLNPMLGALAMALSSVTVVLNANRLLKSPKKPT